MSTVRMHLPHTAQIVTDHADRGGYHEWFQAHAARWECNNPDCPALAMEPNSPEARAWAEGHATDEHGPGRCECPNPYLPPQSQ